VPETATAPTVEQVYPLAGPRVSRPIHDEANRDVEAMLVVQIAEIRAQDDLALAKLEASLLPA
jgi:hypothetical protein